MVHVEDRLPADVLERRQLMHPLAVIALVVGSRLGCRPAAAHQRGFNLGEGAPGHEDVDVREDAAAGSPQPGEQVRRALEQNDRDAAGGERPIELGLLREVPAAPRATLAPAYRRCLEYYLPSHTWPVIIL
jgi:hypothetical protein